MDPRAAATNEGRRVGAEKGIAISKSVQFGKGYKRKIYDNALLGWLPLSFSLSLFFSLSRVKREIGVREGWAWCLTLPPQTFHHLLLVLSSLPSDLLATLVGLHRPTSRTYGGRYVGVACPTSVATPEFCACHGRHCVRTCVSRAPSALIPGFRKFDSITASVSDPILNNFIAITAIFRTHIAYNLSRRLFVLFK